MIEKKEKLETNSPNFLSTRWYNTLWDMANFSIVASLTSAGVITIQSPLKTLILSVSQSNKFLPTYTGGTLGLFKVLYAGTQANLSVTTARTVYVTGTNNKSTELEEISRTTLEFKYILSAAAGDVGITQIPETISQLRKIPGLLPSNFKWHTPYNTYHLLAGGIFPRYISGVINFACMFHFEQNLASRLPIEDQTVSHFVAGALSGMAGAFFSNPFSMFKDYLLIHTKVTSNGLLVNKKSWDAFKELTDYLRKNPKHAIQHFLLHSGKQLPLRMVQSAAIFSLIVGTGEILGTKPLNKILPEKLQPVAINPQSFFANSEKNSEGIEIKTMRCNP